MLFFSSYQPIDMPKTTGIPKSLLADIKSLKTKLAALEKNLSSVVKDSKSTMSMIKSHAEMLKKHQSTIAQQGSTISQQESTIAQLGKKSVKKEKRKPSEYNLFLKGKMTQGMSMIDAVKAWKERDSSSSTSSSTRQGQDWQSPTQQY
jgi:septal ring factor EnvC (AmiA/AmiB activator)